MSPQNITAKQKKILLLEDEETLGRIYTKHLEMAGFKVKWLKTTVETIETAKEFKADIILLDHSISGEEKTGLDIISDLKAILPDAKIFMLSNYSQFQMEKEVLKAGGTGYLVKIDIPPSLLADYVRKLFF